MSATKSGGLKSAVANKKRYGDDFYKRIGAMGGKKSHPETRYFATNREAASEAGSRGGKISRPGTRKSA